MYILVTPYDIIKNVFGSLSFFLLLWWTELDTVGHSLHFLSEQPFVKWKKYDRKPQPNSIKADVPEQGKSLKTHIFSQTDVLN